MKNFLFLLKTTRTTDSLRHGRMGEFLARWRRAFAACALLTLISPLLAQPGGGGGMGGDGIWRRDAVYGEIYSLDNCLGHQPHRRLLKNISTNKCFNWRAVRDARSPVWGLK